MKQPLGRLFSVPLTEVWEHEERDFSPWLASDSGLRQLAEAIGIRLTHVELERRVGPFRADIFGRREDGSPVIVENQIAKADHKHLGQLITYAAGIKAATIVWIAASLGDEHIAAIDWLNDSTPEGIDFFGVEVSLLKVDQSRPAPFFHVAARPNWWRKQRSSSPSYGSEVERSGNARKFVTGGEAFLTRLLRAIHHDAEQLPAPAIHQYLRAAISAQSNLELQAVNRTLAGIGLRVLQDSGDWFLWIANTHPAIREMLCREENDDKVWRDALLSIPGVVTGTNKTFQRHQSKCVVVPISVIRLEEYENGTYHV